jgi:Glycosyltransferase family 92
MSVSLTSKPCDRAENNLKIINNQPIDGVKKKFVVCSKSITYTDRSFGVKLFEWIYLLKILGADKVNFFYEFIHPEVFNVMKYFEDQGIIEAWPYFNPSGILDSKRDGWQDILLQMNTLNDCFYRMKNLYEFVVILDPDEVILPVMDNDLTWIDIISKLNYSGQYDAFYSQNVYYPAVQQSLNTEIPVYMHMLQHIQRSQNFTEKKKFVKSFHDTRRIKVVHNHTPMFCLSSNSKCHRFPIPRNISQVSHYRSNLRKHEALFNVTIEDKTILKFKDRLIDAVQETLKATKFQP